MSYSSVPVLPVSGVSGAGQHNEWNLYDNTNQQNLSNQSLIADPAAAASTFGFDTHYDDQTEDFCYHQFFQEFESSQPTPTNNSFQTDSQATHNNGMNIPHSSHSHIRASQQPQQPHQHQQHHFPLHQLQHQQQPRAQGQVEDRAPDLNVRSPSTHSQIYSISSSNIGTSRQTAPLPFPSHYQPKREFGGHDLTAELPTPNFSPLAPQPSQPQLAAQANQFNSIPTTCQNSPALYPSFVPKQSSLCPHPSVSYSSSSTSASSSSPPSSFCSSSSSWKSSNSGERPYKRSRCSTGGVGGEYGLEREDADTSESKHNNVEGGGAVAAAFASPRFEDLKMSLQIFHWRHGSVEIKPTTRSLVQSAVSGKNKQQQPETKREKKRKKKKSKDSILKELRIEYAKRHADISRAGSIQCHDLPPIDDGPLYKFHHNWKLFQLACLQGGHDVYLSLPQLSQQQDRVEVEFCLTVRLIKLNPVNMENMMTQVYIKETLPTEHKQKNGKQCVKSSQGPNNSDYLANFHQIENVKIKFNSAAASSSVCSNSSSTSLCSSSGSYVTLCNFVAADRAGTDSFGSGFGKVPKTTEATQRYLNLHLLLVNSLDSTNNQNRCFLCDVTMLANDDEMNQHQFQRIFGTNIQPHSQQTHDTHAQTPLESASSWSDAPIITPGKVKGGLRWTFWIEIVGKPDKDADEDD